MAERTSKRLTLFGNTPTTMGEILKWFGVLILITRFEFGSRASLWSTTSQTRFVPPPCLGETTGMSRNRFDELWRHCILSEQPAERPLDMSHEAWRWMLVDDFVNNFNDHRQAFYKPSWLICVDESISRWYGLGGSWINIALPHYVAMDRKAKHRWEIQSSADGMIGIMMRLKLVQSAQMEEAVGQAERAAAAAADSL